MYGLKPTSLFRPSSRPTSPAPSPVPTPRLDTGSAADRATRPLSKLSLSTFRRPSPSPATTSATAPSTVVQDGSFIEVLGLKLSEAVTKALLQPTAPPVVGEMLGGRRPLPSGRGRALGILITSEIKASADNQHLYRAIIRTLQRPLSVLLTNLSSNLISLLSSPGFTTPPAPTPQEPNPTAAQLHAVALATFAGELLEEFDTIGLGIEVDTRNESLRTTREGLLSIIKRVLDPLFGGIRTELTTLLDALETPAPAMTTATATVPKPTGGIKSPAAHASIMSLQTLVPIYSRALSRYVGSAYAENTLATLLISLVWRGIVALAHRPAPPSPTPPASPSMTPATLKPPAGSKKSTTPPATPPASRFTLKLPPSRPASPPGSPGSKGTTIAADARALYDVLNLLPKPSLTKESTRLAREAVDEAFEGLSALVALLESIQGHVQAKTAGVAVPTLESELELLTEDIPIVIALPILLRTYLPQERSVPAILGMSETDYRKGCLGGFGRAEECGVPVGQRVLDVLQVEGKAAAQAPVFLKWLARELTVAQEEH